MVLGKLDSYMQKNETELFSHTMHKINCNGLKTQVLNLKP